MRTFLSNQRTLVALFLGIALWLSLFQIWARWVTASPLDEVITLAPRGLVNKGIHVVIPEKYMLNLVFERGDVPYQKLKVLLGDWAYKDGKPIPSGVIVPIRWALKDLPDGAVVASGEIDAFGSIAWSPTEVDREVGHVQVAPGKYEFSAEILRDVPELASIRTRLSMQLRPKASSTWQITLVWWGSMANDLLAWPSAFLIAVVLSWRAALTFRSRGFTAHSNFPRQ